MTGTTNPFTLNLNASQALLMDLTRTMAAMTGAQRQAEARARKDYQQWRASPWKSDFMPQAPRDAATDSMMNCFFTSMLLDGLFGMPLFGGMSDATHGLAQMGLMAAQEEYDEAHASPEQAAMNFFMAQHKPKMPKAAPAAFDDMMMIAQQEEALQAMLEQKNQNQQLQMLKKLALVLMMQIMMQQRDEKEERGGQSEGVARDALNRPVKMAQFKQNRQNIACTRTLFQREVSRVAKCARFPQYKLAA